MRERAGKHKLIPGVPVVWLRQQRADDYVIEASTTWARLTHRDECKWIMAHDDFSIPGEYLAVDDLHPLGALYVAALDGDDAALLEAAKRLRGGT